MDRRMQGAVLLAVVLIAAIVVPNLHARTIRGTALLGPVPGAPRLGQCLLQTPPDSVTMANPGRSYRLGTCAGQHFGEVAEVIPDVDDNVQTDTSPAKLCLDEDKYLGWTPPVPSTAAVQWRPIDVNAIELDPTATQRKFGQNWAVCVITPATPGAGYTGSVRNAYSSGSLPIAFADCESSDDPTSTLPAVGCDQPHRYEVFGLAELSAGYRDQDALDTQCGAIVRTATRMTDITDGGALQIRAVVFHADSDYNLKRGFATDSVGAKAVCTVAVAGARQLTGTLFGIGHGALPWA